MSDAKKLHRFLRSLLIAGASVLIIASAAFAGSALSPAPNATAVSQLTADDDPAELDEAGNVDPPEAETPDVDEVDEHVVNGADRIPSAVEVEEDAEAPEADDQDQNEDADDTDAVDDDQDEDQDDDDDEADDDEADDDDDEADDDDEDDSDDSGEDDD